MIIESSEDLSEITNIIKNSYKIAHPVLETLCLFQWENNFCYFVTIFLNYEFLTATYIEHNLRFLCQE